MEQSISKIVRKTEYERTTDELQLLKQNPEIAEKVELKRNKTVEQKDRLREFEDSSVLLREKCAKLAAAIKSSRRLVIYTGAGISTSANIPDYRGPNGVWTLLDKGKEVASCDLGLAQPTTTHMALFMLHKQGKISHIVSQNCDGLHLRSGIPRSKLSEVHGNMFLEVCKGCKPVRPYVRLFDVTERTNRYRHHTKRRCYICGGGLVDTIVHFGERGSMAWPINWNGACKAAEKADMILCLGSSLKVLRKYPWLWCMDRPANKRPPLYIVNLQWTPKDSAATLKLNGRCDFVMAEVLKCLRLGLPDYTPYNDPLLTMVTQLHDREEHTTTRRTLIESRPVGVTKISMEATVSESGIISEVRVSNHFSRTKDEFRTQMLDDCKSDSKSQHSVNSYSESESQRLSEDEASDNLTLKQRLSAAASEDEISDNIPLKQRLSEAASEDEVDFPQKNGTRDSFEDEENIENGASTEDELCSSELPEHNGSSSLAKDLNSTKLKNGWLSTSDTDGSLSGSDDSYVPPTSFTNSKLKLPTQPKSQAIGRRSKLQQVNDIKIEESQSNCDNVSSQLQLFSSVPPPSPDQKTLQLFSAVPSPSPDQKSLQLFSSIPPPSPDQKPLQLFSSVPPPSPDHNYAVSPVKSEPINNEPLEPQLQIKSEPLQPLEPQIKPEPLKPEPDDKPKCKFNLRRRRGIPIWKAEELIKVSRKTEELLLKKEEKKPKKAKMPKKPSKPKADPKEIKHIEYRTIEWPKDALYFGYEPTFLFLTKEDEYVCTCCDPKKKRKSPEESTSSSEDVDTPLCTASEEENDDSSEEVDKDEEYEKSSEESPVESFQDQPKPMSVMAPGWFGKGRRKKGRSK